MKKFFLIVVLFFSINIYSQSLIETIDLPSGTFWNYGYGLVFANGEYWISSSSSSAGEGIIQSVDANGNFQNSININYPDIDDSQGLAFDGTNYWYVEREISRCELLKVDPAGNVLDSIMSSDIGSVYMGGAAWDGAGLWYSVYYPNDEAALYKVDVSTKQIVDTIPTFGTQPAGITVKGDTLFYVMDGFEGDDERIYAVDMATKDTLFSWHVPETPGTRQNPRGLAWDGTYFWLLAEPVGSSSGRMLFKYSLEGGTPEINIPTEFINYTNTIIGQTESADFSVFNQGNAPLTISDVGTSDESIFFIDAVTFPIVLNPGESTDFTVNFQPDAYEFYSEILTVYSDDPVHPEVEIELSGQGVFNGPTIGLSSNMHDFGSIWVGADGVTNWVFEIINMGSDPLEISNLQFSIPEFYYEAPDLPFNVASTDTQSITVYFYPTSEGSYADSLMISNNDPDIPVEKVYVMGEGSFDQYTSGYIFWNYNIPDNPMTGYQEYRVEGLKPINDVTGDGISEVIVCTDNYWTICLDGAGSGTTFPVWSFNSYITNYNAGSIGQSFDYGVQDAVQIANDLNGDGYNDVVIGTGGGNEHVYVLDGRTGEIIWSFGDDVNYGMGDFEAVDVQRDFNGDGIEDVLAIADGNEEGTGYKRLFLFDGPTGNTIWEYIYPGPNLSFGKSVISIDDITGDNVPDAVIAVGNNGSVDLQAMLVNGATGQAVWGTEMDDYEPKELLELPIPGDDPDIIVAEYFGRIHRLDAETGIEVWEYNIGGLAGVIQMNLIDDLNNDGIQDVMIASFSGNGLNVLSGADGTQIWAYPMQYQYGVAAVPDLNNDGIMDVVTGDQSGTFYCLSGDGNSEFFSQTFPGDRINTVNKMPSIDGNASYELLCGTLEGVVTCFSGGLLAVPVELTSFSASVSDGSVNLTWSTSTETNNKGFEVERVEGKGKTENGKWTVVGFVEGNGSTTQQNNYSFVDEDLMPGEYQYRLKQVDFDGSFEYSKVVNVTVGTPDEYSLQQNYPNPFNPATQIKYQIPQEGKVTLKVFDVLGKEVATLVDEYKEAGSYKLNFDASNLASGVYIYSISVNDFISSKKMILLK